MYFIRSAILHWNVPYEGRLANWINVASVVQYAVMLQQFTL